MKKLKRIIKKVILILSILILNLLGCLNSVSAASLNSADVYSLGDCGQLLKYKGITVKVSYVQYMTEGISYPAYCLDKTKPGAETSEYSVSIQDSIKDVGLWKRIINGYPYKSISELGVANKEEAFTATKQAVYCYIHGNNPNDYESIGEAGERTLNAMKKIIANADSSNESKISSTISINKNISKWKQDSIEKQYVSKEYSVTSLAEISNYSIEVYKENKQDLGGIKLTDLNNKEKNTFNVGESFKILLPLKSITENGQFNLKVNAKVKTKPVLYGTAPDSNYQDYALTTATYEDGENFIKDEYQKNETEIIVLKQDLESGKKLKGVEFELLNESKKVVYSDLKTDADGKITIKYLVPGTYYLRETKSIDGYIPYSDLVKLDVKLNEKLTITVNNSEEKKPVFESIVKDMSVKKLPVTGM